MRNLIVFFFLLATIPMAQAQKIFPGTGVTYMGQMFDDPDWGWSYRPATIERNYLRMTANKINAALAKMLATRVDVTSDTSDMSHVFDSIKIQRNKDLGSRCPYCLFSMSPYNYHNLPYIYRLTFDMIEESPSWVVARTKQDSVSQIQMKDQMARREKNNSSQKEKEIQDGGKDIENEVNKMNLDPNNIDWKKIEKIEKKGNKLRAKADENDRKTKTDDSLYRNLFFKLPKEKIEVIITTNYPLLQTQKNEFLAYKNNSSFLMEEATIPGCTWAYYFFDRAAKTDHAGEPVFTAYIGKVYPNENALPKEFVKPFCVKITVTGSKQQAKEIVSKIDFRKLAEIIQP